MLKLSDFDYNIPDCQIAQKPLDKRDTSRLLVFQRDSCNLNHTDFRKLPLYLKKGDVLVINDTKVLPARLYGKKATGGKAEITLIRETGRNQWIALVKNVHEGKVLLKKGISADITRHNGTMAKVKFRIPGDNTQDIKDILYEIGHMPLPVYIKRDSVDQDHERYQTVYAHREGAIAAPTAGLHFTSELLMELQNAGIELCRLTLHVGYGTFKPVTARDIREHIMDEEYFDIPEDTALSVNKAKSEGRRIIAVGTTVTRALEGASSLNDDQCVPAGKGSTTIFIYPGYRFRVINGMITNFHLPRSTPMMLVAALAGLDHLKDIYFTASREGYRFYSYGDAMLIL